MLDKEKATSCTEVDTKKNLYTNSLPESRWLSKSCRYESCQYECCGCDKDKKEKDGDD